MRAATLIGVARRIPAPVVRMVTASPARSVVLRSIFTRMPQLLSPAGRKATGVIRFDVTGRGRVDTWYVSLGGDRCVVGRHGPARPRATIIVSAFDFVQLATGTDPIRLFADGRLRLSGDTYFGASVGAFFALSP